MTHFPLVRLCAIVIPQFCTLCIGVWLSFVVGRKQARLCRTSASAWLSLIKQKCHANPHSRTHKHKLISKSKNRQKLSAQHHRSAARSYLNSAVAAALGERTASQAAYQPNHPPPTRRPQRRRRPSVDRKTHSLTYSAACRTENESMCLSVYVCLCMSVGF